jgi:RNA polymerase sigma-70 factor (ECF subfamily)
MGETTGPLDFRSLVDQHYALLYRYAYHLSGSAADAEDLTQETYCTAQAKLFQLRDTGSARAWLCSILRNHYLHGRRTNAAALFESLENVPDAVEAVSEPEAALDAERVRQALSELPEAFRTPVVMFYFDEFSYRQIAEQMGVPLGTVMSRLARAKAYLRSRLRSEYAVSRLHPSPQGVT